MSLNYCKSGVIEIFTVNAVNMTDTNKSYIIKCHFAFNPSLKIYQWEAL